MTKFDYIDDQLLKIGEIATEGYFLALRIRGSSPLMSFHTYPQAWIDEYTENAYVLRDPITTWGMTFGGTIRWSSPLLPDPFRIFQKAAKHGLNFGASVAHGPVGNLTICSFSRSDREFTDDEIKRVKEIVLDLHERTAPPKALADEQKDLLNALAKGVGTSEVAATLGMSAGAAERAIKQLCSDLTVRTPQEAVQRARDLRLF